MYNGNKSEDLVQTRLRIYNKQSKKLSLSLPPDPYSAVQAVFRAHYQVYYCKRCIISIIHEIPIQGNGWSIAEKGIVIPIWYTYFRLPPPMPKCSRQKKEKETVYDADIEETVEPAKKNRKKRQQVRN